MERLTKEHLDTLVPPATGKTNGHQGRSASGYDMLAFLAEHHIEARDPEPYKDGVKYTLLACPLCGHTDNKAAVFVDKQGKPGFHCFHDDCAGKEWHDFREHVEPGYANKQEDSQAEKLVTLALQSAETLFMTPKGEMYIRLRIDGHIETLTISERGGAFKRWLVYHYREAYGTIPNANALTQAISALEAQAQWGGTPQQDTYVRVASHGSNIYLDLANEQGHVVEITAQGWEITKNPPVCFRHPEGMLPLPMPVRGGSLEALKPFVNVQGHHWILLKAFILGMLHATGPYTILNLNGEKGTAKSSTARIIRTIFDPHQAPLRREPKDSQAFAIMAQNNYVVAFDNLSHISSQFSDLLCTLSTGAGDAYRKHYSNDEECIFNAMRPQIFTGIEDLATRGDLIDRCINIKLQPISQYRDETTLKREFEAAHPGILGALLDLVSTALRNVSDVQAGQLPRMADFTKWILAAEEEVAGSRGTFVDIYRKNLDEGIDTEIESSLVGGALVKFAATLAPGTSIEEKTSELLARLKAIVDEDMWRAKSWPKNVRALSGQLKRLAPSLRTRGIYVISHHREDGSYVTFTKKADAKSANPDANLTQNEAADAKSANPDANFYDIVRQSAPEMERNDGTLTQTDAKNTDSPSLVQREKEEERGDRGGYIEERENLRQFASAPPNDFFCIVCRAGVEDFSHIDIDGSIHEQPDVPYCLVHKPTERITDDEE